MIEDMKKEEEEEKKKRKKKMFERNIKKSGNVFVVAKTKITK